MFSLELSQFLTSVFPGSGYGMATPQERVEAFALARQRGLNVDGWLRARLLIDVFGAAAEAKVLSREVGAIWEAPSSYNDMKEAFFSAIMAGVEKHRIEAEIATALDRAVTKLAIPEVWNAVLAVADLLPAAGTVSGRKIYKVAARELGSAMGP